MAQEVGDAAVGSDEAARRADDLEKVPMMRSTSSVTP